MRVRGPQEELAALRACKEREEEEWRREALKQMEDKVGWLVGRCQAGRYYDIYIYIYIYMILCDGKELSKGLPTSPTRLGAMSSSIPWRRRA